MLKIESTSMVGRFGVNPVAQRGPVLGARAEARDPGITRRFSKSFYFSTAFLPPEKRRAIRAFYAFCRVTDDMVDAPEGAPQGAPSGAPAQDLAAWRLASRLPAHAQRDPVLYAWSETRDQYRVPQRYVEELIDGCEMDLTVRHYETFEELRAYCYRVASTVGLVSMHIVGVNGDNPDTLQAAAPAAVDLGVALQLTNILRDVGEDLSRGRVYLPQEDLRRFGYREDDLRAGVIDDRFRALMRFEIDRANALYERGWPGIADLKPDGRLAVGAAITLYRGILGRIADNGFDVFHTRAHLTAVQKISRMPGIYRDVRRIGARAGRE